MPIRQLCLLDLMIFHDSEYHIMDYQGGSWTGRGLQKAPTKILTAIRLMLILLHFSDPKAVAVKRASIIRSVA
jgi:hypothetical protein